MARGSKLEKYCDMTVVVEEYPYNRLTFPAKLGSLIPTEANLRNISTIVDAKSFLHGCKSRNFRTLPRSLYKNYDAFEPISYSCLI